MVQVTVSEVGRSPVRNLTYSLLRIDNGKFQFNLAFWRNLI